MMRLKVNIFSRGLILMSLPIIGQLIFIVVIASAMQQAQSNLEKQWREENLLRSAFSLCRSVSDVLMYLQLHPYFRKMIGLDVSAASLEMAKKESRNLQNLSSEDPEKRQAVNKLTQSSNYMLEVLERMFASSTTVPIAPWGTGAGTTVYRSGLKSNGQYFYDAVEDIVKVVKSKDKEAERFVNSFSNIHANLLLLSSVSILLALISGYVYIISIRRPLKHLSSNGQLLAQQRPLLPVLAAGDEFSRIDALLHSAAQEIENLRVKEKEVIENAQDLICTIDGDGIFVDVNPYVSKMLGYEPDFIITKPVGQYAIDEEKALVEEHLHAFVGADFVNQFELKMQHMNGQVVETRWSCLWSNAAKMLFCVVRDVTEEKRVEQLKQDFTDMISHDLRSPLMAMGNSLTLIKSGVKGAVPEAALKRVETSARNVDRLIVLVNDLLDFQKLKAGKMELTLESATLESVIGEAVELVVEAARDKNVEIAVTPGETVLNCDRTKLMQVVVNLLSNAIKFSGTGGRVSVKVRREPGRVILTVADTGPGIKPEFLDRIFEPFEQAPSEKKKEGTGLGLAICKLVVEAHGGSVRAENRDDGVTGCIFTVELQ
jgi:PAS domain S-box-containing protein